MLHRQKSIIYRNTPSLSVLWNAKWIPSGNATLTKPNICITQRENQFTYDQESEEVSGVSKMVGREGEKQLLKEKTMKKTNDRESVV